MKFEKRIKQVTSISVLSALHVPAVLAHPGHSAGEFVHGLLHIEHILALTAAGVIAFAVRALRK
jgi:hypothetical protein